MRRLPVLGEATHPFLVVFAEQGPARTRAEGEGTPLRFTDALVRQREAEIRDARMHLQATAEELETSNEELQTSKEELQSVNEELETVNAELDRKVQELNVVNSDLENLFHGTQIPTLFLDGELRIKRFTTAATEVFRLIESDIGRPIADIASRFVDDFMAEMKAVLRTLVPVERSVRLADDSSTYIMRILPYRRLDNVLDGLVLTFQNVSQLIQLQEQQARLAAIVDSAHDAIVSRTFDGTILSWNEAATRLFGYTAQEVIGRSLSVIVPPELATEIADTEERLKRGEPVPRYESYRLTKDGRRVPVLVAISPVKEASGRVIGSSGIFQDLTDVKEARSLHEESRRKDRFLAVLSHELRGPLASLRICVNLLQDRGTESPRFREAVEVADRQLEQLAALVDQLLDASRVASGRIVLDRSARDMVEVVGTSVGDQRGLLEALGLELTLRLPEKPLWVNGDPLRLSQVLVNLIGNAAKFTPEGGHVAVTLERDDQREAAVLTVRDDGIGIDPEILPRVFEPFSRQVESNGEPEGLGLGLALVRALVGAHGGTVEARSEGRGRGAEFVVHLPLLRPEAVPAPPERAATTGSPAPRRRVLVVEDRRDTAQTLRWMLEGSGHEVEVVGDGEAALETARAFRPAVVLCDIGLPGGMDGYAVAAAIRGDAAYGSPYLIAVTGYGMPEEKARAREVGFDQHLTKGEDPRVLMRLVADLPPRRS